MQINLEKTLDVEVVERHLAELWSQTGAGVQDDEFAVMRARVANLLVYVASKPMLEEVTGIVSELTAIHPSRVLLMLGEKETEDRDIEMSVETFCQTDKRTGAKRLSCEEVTLQAHGSYVAELPSAALPLLVPDLTTFLWWQDALPSDNERPDKVFDALLRASDRLIVDSAEFAGSAPDLLALTKLFDNDNYGHVGISDLNWARLTSWRALLAGFYDVPAYQPLLDRIDKVQIDYVAPERSQIKNASAPGDTVAPQALLIAGWMASRLGWSLSSDQTPGENNEALVFNFSSSARGSSPIKDRGSSPTGDRGSSPTVREGLAAGAITLEFNRVEHAQGQMGKLVQVELHSSVGQPASFAVTRSADNLHLTTEARVKTKVHRGRVVPVRNRSPAQLLGREMEILCNDQIYQEAIAMAARMIGRTSTPSG